MSNKNPNKTLRKRADRKAETLTALLTSETKTEAAERLGISRTTLYERIQKYELQDYLNQYYEDAMEVLSKGTVHAALNYRKKVDHANADISLKASNEIMDRAGITKKTDSTTNVQVNIANVLDKEREEFNLDE